MTKTSETIDDLAAFVDKMHNRPPVTYAEMQARMGSYALLGAVAPVIETYGHNVDYRPHYKVAKLKRGNVRVHAELAQGDDGVARSVYLSTVHKAAGVITRARDMVVLTGDTQGGIGIGTRSWRRFHGTTMFDTLAVSPRRTAWAAYELGQVAIDNPSVLLSPEAQALAGLPDETAEIAGVVAATERVLTDLAWVARASS